MSWSSATALLAFGAGVAGATQIAVQGRLGDRVGTIEAVATAAVVGTTIALVSLLLVRHSFSGIGHAFAGPKWQLLGGVASVFIVLTITVAGPRIGVVATTAFVIAAQLTTATIIDRYGWFGIESVPISWPRIVGIVLLLTGAALTLRR